MLDGLVSLLRCGVCGLLVACGVLVTTTAARATVCGDLILDVGEQCDGGDCCTGLCTFADAGTACSDDGLACTQDQCDAAGTCAHAAAPLNTCLVAPKGKLQIAN